MAEEKAPRKRKPSEKPKRTDGDAWKTERPQNKNLRPINELRKTDPQKAFDICSKGGKESQKILEEKKTLKDILTAYSDLPVIDARKRNRLLALGLDPDIINQKCLIADALMRQAQAGELQAIAMYTSIMGELGGATHDDKQNNLFITLLDGTKKDIDTDDIPELQQASESDDDVVEPTEIPTV